MSRILVKHILYCGIAEEHSFSCMSNALTFIEVISAENQVKDIQISIRA